MNSIQAPNVSNNFPILLWRSLKLSKGILLVKNFRWLINLFENITIDFYEMIVNCEKTIKPVEAPHKTQLFFHWLAAEWKIPLTGTFLTFTFRGKNTHPSESETGKSPTTFTIAAP